MKEANRNLIVRLVSAGLLVPVLLVVILWQRPEPMAARR